MLTFTILLLVAFAISGALAFAATAVQLGATAALAGALAFGLAATVGLVRTLDWMELRPLPARPSAR